MGNSMAPINCFPDFVEIQFGKLPPKRIQQLGIEVQ
jgi:hypothetical protein